MIKSQIIGCIYFSRYLHRFVWSPTAPKANAMHGEPRVFYS